MIIFPLFFILLSVVLLLYAPVSQYLDERIQLTSYAEYDSSIAEREEAENEAEWQKAVDYNNSLIGLDVKDPFVQGSGAALPEFYTEVLDIEGIMGYIEIPKISVLLPIYHGTSEEVLQKGAGHMQQTFMPVGGESTHCVISAHTGMPHAMMFDELTSLKTGDHFYLHVLHRTLAYEVDEINVVLPTDFGHLLDPVKGEDYVTLITCTPFGINSHRLLVRGTRVEYEEEELKQIVSEEKSNSGSAALEKIKSRLVVSGVFVGILMLVFIAAPLLAGSGGKNANIRNKAGSEKNEKKKKQ